MFTTNKILVQSGGNRCYKVTECSAFLGVSCNIEKFYKKTPTYYIMTISLTCITAHLKHAAGVNSGRARVGGAP